MGLPARLALLIAVLAAGAAFDWLRHRERARRWREYVFLLAAAAVGGLLGALVDLATSALSPEYFVVAKGLSAGPTLRRDALALGFHAGFLTGAVAAGVYLVAAPRAGIPRLAALLLRPLGLALYLAPFGGAVACALDPLDLGARLAGLVPPGRLPPLLAAWGSHAGLYAGALAGGVWGALAARRAQPTRT